MLYNVDDFISTQIDTQIGYVQIDVLRQTAREYAFLRRSKRCGFCPADLSEFGWAAGEVWRSAV